MKTRSPKAENEQHREEMPASESTARPSAPADWDHASRVVAAAGVARRRRDLPGLLDAAARLGTEPKVKQAGHHVRPGGEESFANRGATASADGGLPEIARDVDGDTDPEVVGLGAEHDAVTVATGVVDNPAHGASREVVGVPMGISTGDEPGEGSSLLPPTNGASATPIVAWGEGAARWLRRVAACHRGEGRSEVAEAFEEAALALVVSVEIFRATNPGDVSLMLITGDLYERVARALGVIAGRVTSQNPVLADVAAEELPHAAATLLDELTATSKAVAA